MHSTHNRATICQRTVTDELRSAPELGAVNEAAAANQPYLEWCHTLLERIRQLESTSWLGAGARWSETGTAPLQHVQHLQIRVPAIAKNFMPAKSRSCRCTYRLQQMLQDRFSIKLEPVECNSPPRN